MQSVALRLVCDRELEIETFVAQRILVARRHARDTGRRACSRRASSARTASKITRLDIGTGEEAEAFKRDLELATLHVANVEAKPAKRHPSPPFTTSTLQQEASRKLGIAPARTMQVAQRLYEGADIGGETVGLITYMRTDGVDMAPEAIAVGPPRHRARNMASATSRPRRAATRPRPKNAQEAHEAIRPTDIGRLPAQVAQYLDPEQARLYELIWIRTVASQMESAELERTTVDIAAQVGPRRLDLRATGQVVKFDGFLTLYQEGKDDEATTRTSGRLPPMKAGEPWSKPAHRCDAALHRAAAALFGSEPRQAHGGARHRPALDLCVDLRILRDREYVKHRQEAPHPGGQGLLVIAFLEAFFLRYVEYDFTAALEEQLDRVSNGEIDWKQVLREFWRDFSAAIGETKELRVTEVLDALNELWARTSSPTRATARTRAPARAAAPASSR